MLIDLHMHERTHSPDSVLKLEDMVARARALGLDAICITDHDSLGLRQQAASYAAKVGFPIFVGAEYYSLQGDIVAFGMEELPKRRIDAQAFIKQVNRQGGLCFAAHPYRNNNRGVGDALFALQGLGGVEAFNASTSFAANRKALLAARRLGLPAFGVSDCHRLEKLGVYATLLPGWAHNTKELLALLRQGYARPVAYQQGRYRDLAALSDMMDPASNALPPELVQPQRRKAGEEERAG